MMRPSFSHGLALMAFLVAGVSACDTTAAPGDAVVQPALFDNSNLVSTPELVDCTLSDGTRTQCYEFSFGANPHEDGPYCPETVGDTGGLAIYDGDTNPGLRVFAAAFMNDMETDGYDIVAPDGTVRTADPGPGNPQPSGAACLEATPDDGLVLTYTVPATPSLLATPEVIRPVGEVGISLMGVPIKGDPPSATIANPGRPGGNGAVPALDRCGGHVDPFGYFHWHFGAEEANSVLQANGISDIACTYIPQSTTDLVGFAKDGFPIYASQDASGLPAGLDACGGHTAVTADYADGVYHYHVSATDAPNVPECVVGASVAQPLEIR